MPNRSVIFGPSTNEKPPADHRIQAGNQTLAN
jgi:hypothetical protein